MIKTLINWITGKSDTATAAEAPYKIETPTIPTVEVDMPATSIEISTVTVKAKYKRTELTKMTKAQLTALLVKHHIEVKARSSKEELVKLLVKV